MRLIIAFCILSLGLFPGISLAESRGIKIVQPLDGTIVVPEEKITVSVQAMDGYALKEGWIAIGRLEQKIQALPATVILKVPNEVAGKIILDVLGKDSSNKFASDEITLNVQQTAILKSLEIKQDEIFIHLDWDGNIKGKSNGNFVTIYGIYSDGVKRILNDDSGTSYTSSDSSIISVDNKGNYQVHKVAPAKITISNSGKSKDIPIVFHKPRGIKPYETIAPVTKIDIRPLSNSAGWNNSDITIILTAADNDGGSGVKEIEYVLAGLTGMKGILSEHKIIQGNTAELTIYREGIARFGYYARDNERNIEKINFSDIKIDKTPPVVAITAVPCVLWPPDNKMVDVTIKGEAVDNLSGIESLTFKVIDEYGKIQPSIAGFGSTVKLESSRRGDDSDGRTYTITVIAKDKAGNKSSISAVVTVPHDMGKEKK